MILQDTGGAGRRAVSSGCHGEGSATMSLEGPIHFSHVVRVRVEERGVLLFLPPGVFTFDKARRAALIKGAFRS